MPCGRTLQALKELSMIFLVMIEREKKVRITFAFLYALDRYSEISFGWLEGV